MRKVTRFICVFLLFVVLFSTTVTAAAFEDPRASSYFAVTSASLEKTSSGLKIWVDVTGMDMMDQLGARTVAVQRSSDGSSWSTVKTFTKESYSQMIRTNSAFHSFSLTYSATAGYYYRAVVTFYAKKGTGAGELVQYTSSLKL